MNLARTLELGFRRRHMVRGTRIRRLSPGAKLFFGLVIAAGMLVLLQAALHPSPSSSAIS
jgi:hypothetical protein